MPEATCLLSALLFVGAFSACMSACFLPICLLVVLLYVCLLYICSWQEYIVSGIIFLHKNESFMPKLLYLCYHFSEKHAYS